MPGCPDQPASYPVPVRRDIVYVIGFLQIPPRDGHPCLDLRFRSLRSSEDFHLLKQRHAWRTSKRAAGRNSGGFFFYTCLNFRQSNLSSRSQRDLELLK